MGDRRIVHFTTHGLLDSGYPGLSGLVLSLVDEQGSPRDGFLRMHEIYNLRLRPHPPLHVRRCAAGVPWGIFPACAEEISGWPCATASRQTSL